VVTSSAVAGWVVYVFRTMRYTVVPDGPWTSDGRLALTGSDSKVHTGECGAAGVHGDPISEEGSRRGSEQRAFLIWI
jgi:hypothetical protein